MNSALLRHLVLQQSVDHAVAGRLHLRLERLGSYDQTEVSLPRGTARHGLVVCMEV